MKVKTNELSGAALDWAVAKCWYHDRKVELTEGKTGVRVLRQPEYDGSQHSHWFIFFGSTDWSQGGPIIDANDIALSPMPDGAWRAYAPDGTRWVPRGELGQEVFAWKYKQEGYTPLIAAMRCYVASRLGDEVEVPKELL